MDDALLTKRELARNLLSEMFKTQRRITIASAVELAAQHGVSRRTLAKACKDIGATEIHNGPYPAFWQAPEPR